MEVTICLLIEKIGRQSLPQRRGLRGVFKCIAPQPGNGLERAFEQSQPNACGDVCRSNGFHGDGRYLEGMGPSQEGDHTDTAIPPPHDSKLGKQSHPMRSCTISKGLTAWRLRARIGAEGDFNRLHETERGSQRNTVHGRDSVRDHGSENAIRGRRSTGLEVVTIDVACPGDMEVYTPAGSSHREDDDGSCSTDPVELVRSAADTSKASCCGRRRGSTRVTFDTGDDQKLRERRRTNVPQGSQHTMPSHGAAAQQPTEDIASGQARKLARAFSAGRLPNLTASGKLGKLESTKG